MENDLTLAEAVDCETHNWVGECLLCEIESLKTQLEAIRDMVSEMNGPSGQNFTVMYWAEELDRILNPPNRAKQE